MAAGMNAQDMEAKLVGDVDKAQAAVLKETDPINKAELRRMWDQAENRLYSFRMQQVLGGKGLSQGCRDGIWQQGVPWRESLSRVLPSGLLEVLKPGHAADICTCVFIPPGLHS